MYVAMSAPSPLIDAIIVSVFILLGWLCARWRAAESSEMTGRQKVLVLPVLVLVGASVCGYYLMTHYPAVAWYTAMLLEYYALPLVWALCIGSVSFAFVVTIALRARSGRRWRLLADAYLVLLVLAELHAFTAEWGERPRVRPERRDENGIIRQSTGASCAAACGAAACGANIAQLFGIEATETQMIDWMGTTVSGTSTSQMVYGLRHAGIEARKVAVQSTEIERVRPPAIIFLGSPSHPDDHAVVFLGVEQGNARIIDPLWGVKTLTPSQVAARWSGRAIEASKAEAR